MEVMVQNMGWGVKEGGWRKGPWTAEEDKLLIRYVKLHGEGKWNNVARLAGTQLTKNFHPGVFYFVLHTYFWLNSFCTMHDFRMFNMLDWIVLDRLHLVEYI